MFRRVGKLVCPTGKVAKEDLHLTSPSLSSFGLDFFASVHFCSLPPEQTCAPGVMSFKESFGESMLEELLVLVIEDDPEIQALIDEALCDGGYEPALART